MSFLIETAQDTPQLAEGRNAYATRKCDKNRFKRCPQLSGEASFLCDPLVPCTKILCLALSTLGYPILNRNEIIWWYVLREQVATHYLPQGSFYEYDE